MVEKKTTKTNNTTQIKRSPKKTTDSKKPKSLVLEIAKEEKKETCSFNHEEKCKKGLCCRKIIHIIEFLLLIANFVLLLVVLCQIKKVNYWTEL
jgi:hypothetical protein